MEIWKKTNLYVYKLCFAVINFFMAKVFEDLDFLERKFKGLASSHRIKILRYLESGEKSLPQIEEHLKPLASTTVFEHVRKLYNYQIIKRKRTSENVFYSVSDAKILTALSVYNG